ncbi:glycosidase [Bifidobacterium cuniculi]|uniref:Glycosidase n=1 Tax=Bifidobacterium cuniculi TaxID=1688 RepID=A0A087B2N4_9BIFI|nr:glycosidase [Bifidobacterium cuniculi]
MAAASSCISPTATTSRSAWSAANRRPPAPGRRAGMRRCSCSPTASRGRRCSRRPNTTARGAVRADRGQPRLARRAASRRGVHHRAPRPSSSRRRRRTPSRNSRRTGARGGWLAPPMRGRRVSGRTRWCPCGCAGTGRRRTAWRSRCRSWPGMTCAWSRCIRRHRAASGKPHGMVTAGCCA